jgi:hypothetical protein
LKLLRFAAPLLYFAIAAAIVALKLPPDAQYVGTDVGFSFTSPARHIFDLTWYAWSWYGAGSINLYNLSVSPFYAVVELFHVARLSAVQISHAWEVLQFGGIGLGAYLLSAAVLGSATRRDVLTSLFVGFFAMFSYFGAIAFMIPASLYQPAFIAWPALIAWEIRLLRTSRGVVEIAAFALVLFAVLSLNLAHTVVALALVIALAAATATSIKSWPNALRVGGVVATVVFLLSMPFWISIAVYHHIGGTPLIASANLTRFDALIEHIRYSHGLSSFTGLFRLNTIVWWPTVDPSIPWQNPFVLLSTFAIAALAVAGICNASFDFFTRRFWGAAFLVSLFLAKGIHAPFGAYYAKLLSLPMAEMLREANDKFMLAVFVSAIVLAAIGLRSLQTRFPQLLAGFALACGMIPFFFSQPLLDEFIVRVPADYTRVQELLGDDPAARVFSLAPSNLNEQGSTYWFHGSNLDDALFRNPITYSTTYESMGLSSGAVYGDDHLVGAQEYFADRQIGKILGIRYILVHKDFTQGFDIGFSHTQDVHVNGQQIAAAILHQCDMDRDLERLFDGPYLRLYRVRTLDSPLAAMPRLHAVRGYANALFPMLELSPGNRGFVFSGTQTSNISNSVPAATYADRVLTFVARPSAALASDQILGSQDTEASIAGGFAALPVPSTAVGAMPPGDYFSGYRGSTDMVLRVPSDRSVRAPFSAFYRHRSGYSAVESKPVTLVPSTPPPLALDIGRGDPNVLALLASKNLVSRPVDVRFPLAGEVHAFLTLSGTRMTLADPAAVEFVLEDADGPVTLWIPVAGWDALVLPQRTLLATLNAPTSPAIGTLNVDVTASAVAQLHADSAHTLNRPGLHIVGARMYVARNDSERFDPMPVSAMRFYDAQPDDYRAQAVLASLQATDSLSASGAFGRPRAVADLPGGLLMTTPSVAEKEFIRAQYDYPVWKRGQLVLIGHALLQPTGSFSATVDYTYVGHHFTKDFPIAASPEREPYGLMPVVLDDPQSGTGEASDWARYIIDLRALLPSLSQTTVERVTVSVKLSSAASGPSNYAFGPLEGYGNGAPGYPLTALAVNGNIARPSSVKLVGADAAVDFGTLLAPRPGLTVVSGPPVANVPSAVGFGPKLAPNPTMARGTLLDPTLATIVTPSAGIVELGTSFNNGWVLRRGSPRPYGILRELGAWITTQPVQSTHFVGEGFANDWTVPAGTYTVVFLPQVVRDVTLLVMPVAVALVIAIGLLWTLVRRRSVAR